MRNETHSCGVISKLDDVVAADAGSAVMGQEGEESSAHTTKVTLYSLQQESMCGCQFHDSLLSNSEEVQDPVAGASIHLQ